MDVGQWTDQYIQNLKLLLDTLDKQALSQAVSILEQARSEAKTIYVVGNGGSASTATHIACDFSKTVIGHKGDASWKPFKCVSLTDNASLITAWSNDVDFQQAYAQQLENLGSEGDVLIAISSSGSSKNIMNCIGVAKSKKIHVIGIAGFNGGQMKDVVDVCLSTDSQEYGPIEDIQMIMNHLMVFYFYQKFSSEQ